jgi:hypothetical protein
MYNINIFEYEKELFPTMSNVANKKNEDLFSDDFLPVAPSLFEDLTTLDNIPFDEIAVTAQDATESVEQETEEEYKVENFVYNIQNLLPDFEQYFQNKKSDIFETASDKLAVEEIKENTKYNAQQELDTIKFKSDDDIVEAIFGYLMTDILVERLTTIKDSFHQKLTALHKQAPITTKTLDLPVLKIMQKDSEDKPELVDKKAENFIVALEQTNLDKEFASKVGSIDWSLMTKGGIEKIVQIMQSSDKEDLREMYKHLEENEIIRLKPGGSTYQITSKIKK